MQAVLDTRRGYPARMQRLPTDLSAIDAAWRAYRRWIVWGPVAWRSNINPKQATLPSLERFCVAAGDLGIEDLFDL